MKNIFQIKTEVYIISEKPFQVPAAMQGCLSKQLSDNFIEEDNGAGVS